MQTISGIMVKITCGTQILALISIMVFCNFLCSTNCNKLNRTREPRLIKGVAPANRSRFPFQALIQYHGWNSKSKLRLPYFAGAIISEEYVLAHSWGLNNIPATSLSVIVGNMDLNDQNVVKKVLQIYIPELKNPDHYLALLKIDGSFEPWTELIRPIILKTDKTTSGTCVMSGFDQRGNKGDMSSKLRFVEMSIMSWTECNKIVTSYIDTELQPNMICSRQNGFCDGDNSGSLVCSDKLAAMVSWTYDPCGERTLTVFVEVAKYVKWIKDNDALCARVRAAHAVSLASFSAQSWPSLNLISLLIIFFIGKIVRNL